MKVGFIGLGNIGGKLAGSLLRNGFALTVRDLNREMAEPLLAKGASWGESPRAMAESVDLIITCLPSPAASAAVMEAEDGILAGLSAGQIWAEMSTTDESEVKRLGALVQVKGAEPIDCPVSGGVTGLQLATSRFWPDASVRPSNVHCQPSRPWAGVFCTPGLWAPRRS